MDLIYNQIGNWNIPTGKYLWLGRQCLIKSKSELELAERNFLNCYNNVMSGKPMICKYFRDPYYELHVLLLTESPSIKVSDISWIPTNIISDYQTQKMLSFYMFARGCDSRFKNLDRLDYNRFGK